MKSITDLELGFADAVNYRKRENKDLFNKIFVKGEYLDRLCESDISFLIGEKGTGKTAYAIYLTNNNYKNIIATTRFVRETDYSKFIQLKRDKHLNISDFISIWKVILYLLLANQIKEKENDFLNKILQYPYFKLLNDAINEYYMDAFSPEIINAITFVENSKEAAELLFKYAKMNGEESRQITFTENKFQINLMYIEKKFKEALSKLKLKNDHILFIDGIDIRPPQILFDEYQECVKGLANAVWSLNNDIFPSIKGSKGRIRIVLLIRPDIFESLGLQNQNTKIQDNSVFLDWRTSYISHRESRIFNLFDHLLRTQQEPNNLEKGISWDYYFPWDASNLYDNYQTKTSFVSFLRNSYYRPRDILQMIKFLQENHNSEENFISESGFEDSEFQRKYSNYLLGEVKDHLLFYYSQDDYQKFLKFFEFLNGKNKFSYNEYIKSFNKLTEYLPSIDGIIPKFMSTANEFLQFLFDINVICYIETPEGGDKPYFHWCFKDRNYANISPKVKSGVEYQVFYGLTKALDLGTAFKR
jgi:funZ protein